MLSSIFFKFTQRVSKSFCVTKMHMQSTAYFKFASFNRFILPFIWTSGYLYYVQQGKIKCNEQTKEQV